MLTTKNAQETVHFFWGKVFRLAETFAKLNLKQKSVRYRVGIPAHHNADRR